MKPVQESADDTEHPPPVPAFDPEILYTQPDKASKPKGGGYENVPHTPGPATAEGDYESVDKDDDYAERTVEQRAAKDKADGYATVDDKGGKVAQPQRPMPADELYSTPDMSQKRNRRRESQGSVGEEGPKDTPPDTLTAVDQLYATPDMSKKQRKQPHVSPEEEQQDKDDEEDAPPPEVPVYQPMTGVNSK